MLLALAFFLVVPFVGALRQGNDSYPGSLETSPASRGFLLTKYLPDGQLQRILKRPSICAKETLVHWGDTDVALWEVWLEDVARKLQFIYQNNRLTDCVDRDLSKDDWEESCLALETQIDDRTKIETLEFDASNVTHDDTVQRHFSWLTSPVDLGIRCERARTRAKLLIMEQKNHGKPTRLDQTSRERKEKRPRSRSRRDLFLIPGTQWCGRGHRATKYTNLGGFGSADACCRKHDTACPFFIPSLESRYGLFNWGISTMMHCSCDERFRTCLKMTGTSSADFIGKIFFDVFRSKCFVLKPQKVCVKRSWWGKCQRYIYKKQAHTRENISY